MGLLMIAFAPTIALAESPVILPGACCLPNNECREFPDPITCAEAGGTFNGIASDCADADCDDSISACDDLIAQIRCPEQMVFETDGPNGLIVPLPKLPNSADCEWTFAYDPPIDSAFPVGITPVAIIAYDDEMVAVNWVCGFDVVVDLVSPPDRPRRKGQGGGENLDCNPIAFLTGDSPACGACTGPAGLMMTCFFASRRRRPRR